jgi:uncharacterized membrane protein YczE
MEFGIGYMMALIIVGISFLGFFLSMMIDEVNRRKAVITFILSLILFGLGVYYYYQVNLWQKERKTSSINKPNNLSNLNKLPQQTESPTSLYQPEK